MSWLDRLSLPILLIVAVTLMLAPFPLQDTPHLVEKLRMLADGQLTKLIDVGDLLLHGIPAVILLMKVARMIVRRRPLSPNS